MNKQINTVESNENNKKGERERIIMINYIMKENIKFQNQIQKLKVNDEICKKVHTYLIKNKSQFKSVQQDQELNNLSQVMEWDTHTR